MYAGESRVPSMASVDQNGPPMNQQNIKGEQQGASESGPALEVIQLANGETIWSVSFFFVCIFVTLTPFQVYC